MRMFDSVKLNEDLPEYGIKAGTEGAIVHELGGGIAFMVEFFDADGKTIDVVDVTQDKLTVTLADFFPNEQIALITHLSEHKLQRGQVGTIKKPVGVGLYDVEFANKHGIVYAQVLIHANQMMLLHWQSISEQRSA